MRKSRKEIGVCVTGSEVKDSLRGLNVQENVENDKYNKPRLVNSRSENFTRRRTSHVIKDVLWVMLWRVSTPSSMVLDWSQFPTLNV